MLFLSDESASFTQVLASHADVTIISSLLGKLYVFTLIDMYQRIFGKKWSRWNKRKRRNHREEWGFGWVNTSSCRWKSAREMPKWSPVLLQLNFFSPLFLLLTSIGIKSSMASSIITFSMIICFNCLSSFRPRQQQHAYVEFPSWDCLAVKWVHHELVSTELASIQTAPSTTAHPVLQKKKDNKRQFG